jgi:hypothetical protein
MECHSSLWSQGQEIKSYTGGNFWLALLFLSTLNENANHHIRVFLCMVSITS